jgi:hypothetical protein
MRNWERVASTAKHTHVEQLKKGLNRKKNVDHNDDWRLWKQNKQELNEEGIYEERMGMCPSLNSWQIRDLISWADTSLFSQVTADQIRHCQPPQVKRAEVALLTQRKHMKAEVLVSPPKQWHPHSPVSHTCRTRESSIMFHTSMHHYMITDCISHMLHLY